MENQKNYSSFFGMPQYVVFVEKFGPKQKKPERFTPVSGLFF